MTLRVAFYKGRSRPFNLLVSWKMDGPYSHTEAVLGTNPISGLMTCASSSFMDGGVRFKDIELEPDRWDIIEVAGVDPERVAEWFRQRLGQPYDVRGLVSFVLPVGNTPDGYFCNEAVGAAIGLPEPARFDPNSFACVLERLGGVWVQGGPPWAENAAALPVPS